METHLICILFFIYAVWKVHLKLAWHLDGNGAYVWLFMFLFSPLFCFSFSSLLIISPSLYIAVSFSMPSACLPLYPFIFCLFSLCINWLLLSVFCIYCLYFSFWLYLLTSSRPLPTLPSLFSVLFCLSLRSQWVWLRGECGVPPLSLAIKAMPTPRLHMSSRPSKRGGVLPIRSAPSFRAKRPSVCACLGCKRVRSVCPIRLCLWQKMSIMSSNSRTEYWA